MISRLMLNTSVRRLSTVAIKNASHPESFTPLVEKFRTSWPDAAPKSISITNELLKAKLPERTVSEDILRFEMSATYDPGSSLFYAHMKTNPADFKVIVRFAVKDLNLTPNQTKIFTEMLGPRYNVGNQEVKLTASRFNNRVENKRYLLFLLENLLLETKRICALVEAGELTEENN